MTRRATASARRKAGPGRQWDEARQTLSAIPKDRPGGAVAGLCRPGRRRPRRQAGGQGRREAAFTAPGQRRTASPWLLLRLAPHRRAGGRRAGLDATRRRLDRRRPTCAAGRSWPRWRRNSPRPSRRPTRSSSTAWTHRRCRPGWRGRNGRVTTSVTAPVRRAWSRAGTRRTGRSACSASPSARRAETEAGGRRIAILKVDAARRNFRERDPRKADDDHRGAAGPAEGRQEAVADPRRVARDRHDPA